jgi:hypothetical protein
MIGLLLVVLGLVLASITPADIPRLLDALTFAPIIWGGSLIYSGAVASKHAEQKAETRLASNEDALDG